MRQLQALATQNTSSNIHFAKLLDSRRILTVCKKWASESESRDC